MSALLIRQDLVKSFWWQVSSRISIIQDGRLMLMVSDFALSLGTYSSKSRKALFSSSGVASIQKVSSILVIFLSFFESRYVMFRLPVKIIDRSASLIPICWAMCFCLIIMVVNLHKQFTQVKHIFTICKLFFNHWKSLHFIYIDPVNRGGIC